MHFSLVGDSCFPFRLTPTPEARSLEVTMRAIDGKPDVKLRLRFHTSNSQTGDGVYVDNIRVLGAEVGA